MRALAASFVALLSASPALASRTTVAVAPLVTASSIEYQWIGKALASALTTRVALQPELNCITLRQLQAAMRSDNLDPTHLSDPTVAQKLGKLVGADVIVVGSYAAAWPDLQISLKAYDPWAGKEIAEYDFGSDFNLIQTEARAAILLAKALGADKPNVTPGAFGTESIRAWRATTLALDILDEQSLGPQAAYSDAQLSLPKAALEKAKAEALEGTKLDPEFGEAWATLGVAQALLGETEDAWRWFGKATALGYGHHPTAIVGAAFVRMREGKYDEAAKILTAAISRRPGFLLARGYLAELYTELGRYKEALAVYNDYAAVAPRQPWVLVQRGYIKSKLGDKVGAIADSIAAVDLVPDSPSLLIQLASRYIDASKLIGAEDALRHAIELFPEETRAYVRLGYVYLLENKDNLAIPVSEKALVAAKLRSTGNDKAYAHLNLARAYGHQGDFDKAFEHLQAAKENGLGSLAEVEKDPKLGRLRKDPRYRKLVP
jgi:tetratricopeptide (TPR) repeat protein